MSLAIGKSRAVPIDGISGINVASPVSEMDRIQFNGDGTLTVLVNFYEDQAAFDDPDVGPYETFSYQISEPASFQAIINAELKTLSDFDLAI